MKLSITHQESYSRGQLILRTLFGWLYIAIPHMFVLFFVSIWFMILDFVKFWVVLFTGTIPESIYEFQLKVWKWQTRLGATLYNLVDGYPAIGPGGSSDAATVEFANPEQVGRGLVLVRALFGSIYVGIPHGFLLFFRGIATQVVAFVAWWAVLFTGSYPERMHTFVVGYFLWSYRVNLYLSYYTDDYPPFNGKE